MLATRRQLMVDILKTIQKKYVPVDADSGQVVRLQQIAFAGNQLTAAQARKSGSVTANSMSHADSLHGFVPFASDWHAKVNFMEVCMYMFVYPYMQLLLHSTDYLLWCCDVYCFALVNRSSGVAFTVLKAAWMEPRCITFVI